MDAQFEIYELPQAEDFVQLVAGTPDLRGVTVTIPYKQEVMPLLHSIDPVAQRIGAVNVIKISPDGQLSGYNSDYYGFRISLSKFLPHRQFHALVLGTGGAAKAVGTALEDMGIGFTRVTRHSDGPGTLDYDTLKTKDLGDYRLIINTTPLGTFPNVAECPDLHYDQLGPDHYLHDLVYNPDITTFMRLGLERGAKAKNGLEMLYEQAEEAWRLWAR